MGTYVINLAHNFTGETNYIIIVPRKTTAPITDVICTINGTPGQTRIAYPAPHAQESMVVEGLDPVIYFFKCYRSADGVTLDEQINVIALNARTGASQVLTRYEYVVDRGDSEADVWADPVAGDTGIGDTRLQGKSYYIEERGTGSFMDEEIVDREAGGFDFSDPDKTFEGGVYFAWVANDVTRPDGGSASAATFDLLQLIVNTTFDPVTHGNKILQAALAGNVLTLTFGALSGVADCDFSLDANAGTQRSFVIKLNAGDTAKFLGVDRNKIILGKGDFVSVKIRAGVMLFYGYSGEAKRRGQRIQADFLLPNTYFLAGTGPHNLIDWPSVQEILDNELAGAIITSFATWGNSVTDGGPNNNAITKFINKGKWCVPGDGTFYFPDTRNQFYRGINYTVAGDVATIVTDIHREADGAGGLQLQILDQHYHNSGTETNPAAGYRRGAAHAARAWSATAGLPSGNPASTEVNISFDLQQGDTRPDNIGQFNLICI